VLPIVFLAAVPILGSGCPCWDHCSRRGRKACGVCVARFGQGSCGEAQWPGEVVAVASPNSSNSQVASKKAQETALVREDYLHPAGRRAGLGLNAGFC